jgi:hypothetical protein
MAVFCPAASSSRSTNRSAPSNGSTCWPAHDHLPLEPGPASDADGIPAPGAAVDKVRARLSRFWYGDALPKPSAEDLHELNH